MKIGLRCLLESPLLLTGAPYNHQGGEGIKRYALVAIKALQPNIGLLLVVCGSFDINNTKKFDPLVYARSRTYPICSHAVPCERAEGETQKKCHVSGGSER